MSKMSKMAYPSIEQNGILLPIFGMNFHHQQPMYQVAPRNPTGIANPIRRHRLSDFGRDGAMLPELLAGMFLLIFMECVSFIYIILLYT
jgi:hypothetical protein